MKRETKTVLIALAGCALALAPFSEAIAKNSRLYFASYMGLSLHPTHHYSGGAGSGEIESSNAYNFAGALGLRLTRNVRVEAELGYRRSDFSSLNLNGGGVTQVGGPLRTTTLMFSGIYDFDLWERLTPFVNVGVGVAWHDGKVEGPAGAGVDVSDSDVGLAWSMGGGLRYKVRDGMSLTGSYRYLGTSDVGLENTSIGYGSHEFRIGVNYDLY